MYMYTFYDGSPTHLGGSSVAEKMDGVRAFISVGDITGSNITGNIDVYMCTG